MPKTLSDKELLPDQQAPTINSQHSGQLVRSEVFREAVGGGARCGREEAEGVEGDWTL